MDVEHEKRALAHVALESFRCAAAEFKEGTRLTQAWEWARRDIQKREFEHRTAAIAEALIEDWPESLLLKGRGRAVLARARRELANGSIDCDTAMTLHRYLEKVDLPPLLPKSEEAVRNQWRRLRLVQRRHGYRPVDRPLIPRKARS